MSTYVGPIRDIIALAADATKERAEDVEETAITIAVKAGDFLITLVNNSLSRQCEHYACQEAVWTLTLNKDALVPMI